MSTDSRPPKWTKADTSRLTNSSARKTSKAWHQAREDAQNSKHPDDKNLTKNWKRTPDKDRK